MKKLIRTLLIVTSCLAALSAQESGKISMKANGANPADLRLSELAVSVSVTGNIATTTFDMIFVNNTNRILEGEFEFPLGAGQTVSGYALDINGKLRNGVVVEKEKGREVFDSIVRRKIDPGLVEMTGANNFRTRVYPIPAKGSRRVVISYEQEVSLKNGVRTYVLQPLTNEKLDVFKLDVNVFKQTENWKSPADKAFSVIGFDSWNSGYDAHFEKKDFHFDRAVSISLPDVPNTNSVYTETVGNDTYFYYYTPVSVKPEKKTLPKNITVFYDVSSSAEKRDTERELNLLEKYARDAKALKITAVVFSNEVHAQKTFNVAEFPKLRAFLKEFKFDGGTNLHNLSLVNNSAKVDEIILFSDGISNWKNKEDFEVSSSVPVITVNSSATADHAFLQMIAKKTGGTYADLSSVTDEEALNLLETQSLRLIKLEYDKTRITEVYPAEGALIQDTFSLSGILKKKDGVVIASLGYGNEIKQTIKIEISAVKGIDAENIRRIWAQKKISELSVFYDKNKSEITDLAKRFGIVTKDTSLIVLDSVSDYVRYGITPPDELKDEYARLVRNSTKSGNQNGISDYVYKEFEAFKKWWNTEKGEFKKQKKNRKGQPGPAVMMDAETGAVFYDVADAVAESAVSVERRADVMLNSAASPTSKMSAPQRVSGNPQKAAITLQSWEPDVDYLTVLKRTATKDMYGKYLELKEQYRYSPAFYMDTADYFMSEDLNELAVRILSNLAELELENSDVLRALGNKLTEYGMYDEAVTVFKKLTEIRSEIPQFYRDLAMAYNYAGEKQKAVDTLYHIVTGKWDGRFHGIEQIALNDMNAIIDQNPKMINTRQIDSRLMQNFPVDMRVVLTWNTDDCDIDLWVTDPSGEKCYYSNNLTEQGGKLSRDFTQGYGPEEFCIKEAPEGNYKIEVNYYGTSSQKLLQPVIVQAEVYTDFGKPSQKRQVLTLQLDTVKGSYTVGSIDFSY